MHKTAVIPLITHDELEMHGCIVIIASTDIAKAPGDQ